MELPVPRGVAGFGSARVVRGAHNGRIDDRFDQSAATKE
jgi:hypothetical protein